MVIMHLSLVLFSFIICLTKVDFAHGLSCLVCEKTNCEAVDDCKGGIGKDACGCCDVCNKVIGETCGGPFGVAGSCDEGLYCAIGRLDQYQGICAPCPKCYKYGKFRDENDCKVCVNQKYLNEECGNKVGTCKSNMECRNGKCSLPRCPRISHDQSGCPQVVTTFCDRKCMCCTSPDSCLPNFWFQSNIFPYCEHQYVNVLPQS